ncbi:hypothetical protein [Brevundimonas sp. Root1423]|uniref:hypothetical protein n=1 Tax=Brevundimonas sp. Root1423 TaxID=1736462 RepID=UPI0012E3A992|nr:hypothetical protein [Brevundimonas sp. Root1423]
MTFFATVLTAVIVQLAPPPPQITLIQLPGDNVSVEGRMATRTILDKLQPAYLVVRPSTLPTEDFGRCWTQQPATEACLARALDRAGAQTGEVILAFWERDGILHWLCVGKSGRPFTGSRQSVALGPLADLYRDGESEVLHQAAACLTYAGHQSGW